MSIMSVYTSWTDDNGTNVHLHFMDRRQREQEQGLNSSIKQDQGSSESVEIQVFFAYLSILGVLLSVKYQGVGISLFEEHKKIIYIFVTVISIYGGTIIVGKKLGTKAIEPIRHLSGTIAPILLFFILVPALGWLALGLWVILAAKMAWDYLPQLYYSFGSGVIIAAKMASDYLRQLYYSLGSWVIIAAKMASDYLQQLYYSLGSWVIIAGKMAWDYLRQLYYHLRDQASHIFNSFATLMTRNSTSVEESQERPPV